MNDAACFVDWLDPMSWDVLPGIAARPIPTLTLDGWRGTISGVRFHHSVRCSRCRETAYVYTDGGTVAAGLEKYGNGRKVRWFLEERSNRYPALPEKCPNPGCGNTNRPFACDSDDIAIRPSGPEPIDMLNTIWGTLRAEFPDLVATADKVTSRYSPAPRKKRYPR